MHNRDVDDRNGDTLDDDPPSQSPDGEDGVLSSPLDRRLHPSHHPTRTPQHRGSGRPDFSGGPTRGTPWHALRPSSHRDPHLHRPTTVGQWLGRKVSLPPYSPSRHPLTRERGSEERGTPYSSHPRPNGPLTRPHRAFRQVRTRVGVLDCRRTVRRGPPVAPHYGPRRKCK